MVFLQMVPCSSTCVWTTARLFFAQPHHSDDNDDNDDDDDDDAKEDSDNNDNDYHD